jgi:5-methylthioadenosine/S-adenosylhomocysteine deaminase
MKLASGVARIPELLGKGVKVGLGSDGIKENNRIDIIQEMKFAGLIQKGFHRNASLMPANMLLRMATTYGSEALGLGPATGSLEKGKKADVILINLKNPHTTPVLTGEFYNIPYHLVYSSQAADVDTTIVDGKIIMRNRKVLTVDEEDVIEKATIATEDLLERRKPFVPKD